MDTRFKCWGNTKYYAINRKSRRKKNISQILLTSNTLSSSKVFKKFKLKKLFINFPIDNDLIVVKFLNYWKPSIAIFVESEIWPNMIFNLKKEIFL